MKALSRLFEGFIKALLRPYFSTDYPPGKVHEADDFEEQAGMHTVVISSKIVVSIRKAVI